MADSQTAVSLDLMVNCIGKNHEDMFFDIETALKRLHQVERTTITITDIGAPTRWEIKHEEKRKTERRQEEICGKPPNRLTLCPYTLKVGCLQIKAKVK
jgi:hypothetical protein